MSSEIYYPPPESEGGWRWLDEPEEVRELGKMDPERLDLVRQEQDFHRGGDSWSIVIIRNGYLVREYYTFNVLIPTRFDIWSGTKAFTSMAWGLLMDDGQQGKLPDGLNVDLDSPVYPFIPEGYPLTDPRKEKITIRQLLAMTSGIPTGIWGAGGMSVARGHGPFEHALGQAPNAFGGWVDKLIFDPGADWSYSNPGFIHLALAFSKIMGKEMHDAMEERVFKVIGSENVSWDIQGGSGFIGPHTNAHTGVHISARELARIGYLLMHKGVWNGAQVLSEWWIELATRSGQDFNPGYGFGFSVNTAGGLPGLPRDMFVISGYRSNRCYVIPSLDLVVARVGTGPVGWNEAGLIGGIVSAIIPDEGEAGFQGDGWRVGADPRPSDQEKETKDGH